MKTIFPGRSRLRRELWAILVAWVFGSYWLWTISGAAMTQFARALHTPDFGFGILAALPFLATLMQIPGSMWIERGASRKRVFVWFTTISRLMWTVTAFIPWVLPGFESWWWPVMTASLLVSWATAHLGSPAWTGWMADVIPRGARGRFFGVRNLLGQPVGLLVTLGVGYVLDQAAAVESEQPDLMLKITSAVLGAAGLFGALDILLFRIVRDRPVKPADHPAPLLSMLRAPLADPSFRAYLKFNLVFTFGLGFVGQYVWLYLFDVVGWSNARANLLLIGVPLIVRFFSYPIWGRYVDRLGKKPVMLVCGVMTMFGATGWLLITPNYFWGGYLLVLATVFAWPGMEIANFNILLDLAGSKRKPGEHHDTAGSSYVVLNSIAVAIGGGLSGLAAAVVAQHFHDMALYVPVLDFTLTYHGVLFLASTVVRGSAIYWVTQLHEPTAAGTRDTLRLMSEALYSNVRQAVFMPGRVVVGVFKQAYRINPPREDR